ncbi:MAG: LarC family nickel insertion protein [Thermodesulfobacteriota bacterium]
MELYVEPFSGLSGDMFLGALAELADGYDDLFSLPQALNLPEAEIHVTPVSKCGIAAKHVKIIDNEKRSLHRHLSDILEIIEKGSISDTSKLIAKEIFSILAEAESRVHNIPMERIHFHELSAVDSIMDIVGNALLIDKLGISKTYSTSVCSGFGFVNTQHGKLPVPAPATMNILEGIPIYRGEEQGERVTPTGAAILKYLNPVFDIPTIRVMKTVYGAGEKDFKEPNVLRVSEIIPVDGQ